MFIVSSKERRAWILDSSSVRDIENKDDYPLPSAIESFFGCPFTWTMVRVCYQCYMGLFSCVLYN
ncbi:hypothetical protein Hanom_Chr14g01263941 [Helianthus anomalus]